MGSAEEKENSLVSQTVIQVRYYKLLKQSRSNTNWDTEGKKPNIYQNKNFIKQKGLREKFKLTLRILVCVTVNGGAISWKEQRGVSLRTDVIN